MIAIMSTIRLGPTSYLVLGMVALRGPSNPYQLKQAVAHSVGYFWNFPHAQLYDEPVRLARAGLLEERQEETGRRRRTYEITPAGRAALVAWLNEDGVQPMEIRDVGLLKLFFSELTDPAAVVRLARAEEALNRRRLEEHEGIEQRFAERPDLANRLAPLALGLGLNRLVADFWKDIAERQPGSRSAAEAEDQTIPVAAEP